MPPQEENRGDYAAPANDDVSVSSSLSFTSNRSSREYRIRKSRSIGMIDWTHVLLTHAPQVFMVGILILLAQVVHQVILEEVGINPKEEVKFNIETIRRVLAALTNLLLRFYQRMVNSHQSLDDFLSPAAKTTAIALMTMAWWIRRQKPVYLLSFSTFKPPDSWKCTQEQLLEIMRRKKCFEEDSIEFMQRILERSGTGQATAWPPGIVQCLHDENTPADRSIEASRKEAETVIFDVVEKALRKANVRPKEIDVLIINCSLFSPTPSLCAMVVSHFGLRSNVTTCNMSGMGCSASLLAMDLAKQLLAVPSNRKALVVSTEILTPNFYHGNDRAFLIQNTLFRCGGAAIVLSSSWLDGRRAWYKLLHTVRVQGTDEVSYNCVYETEDKANEKGVRLSKDIVKVAGKCMEKNFAMLGPSILPIREQAKVAFSVVARYGLKILIKFLASRGMDETAAKLPTIKPYVPDFTRGIDHFCIHAGGRAVIDGIEKNMKLEPYHTEPSRMTLLNYGNTSSSSIWYELEYIQEQQKTNPLKKRDRILQVAFGSGFKCGSAVWVKL